LASASAVALTISPAEGLWGAARPPLRHWYSTDQGPLLAWDLDLLPRPQYIAATCCRPAGTRISGAAL